MIKIAAGVLVGLAVGASCRCFGLPAPCPPGLLGALLVASMTVGYVLADRALARRADVPPPTQTRP